MTFQRPVWHDQLTSTNTVLVERVKNSEALLHGTVVAARDQTAGRGRFDRVWQTQPGRDLTFSYLYTERVALDRLVSLPMATALGVADYLGELGLEAEVKWPNDVLVHGRKICGILAESAGHCLVVGIGLNVNMRAVDAEHIDRPATSLQIETGMDHDVSDVLYALLPFLERPLAAWEQGGFGAIADAWRNRAYQLNQSIEVGDGDTVQRGTLTGFGPAGQLRLRTERGEDVEVWAGDVSFGA